MLGHTFDTIFTSFSYMKDEASKLSVFGEQVTLFKSDEASSTCMWENVL